MLDQLRSLTLLALNRWDAVDEALTHKRPTAVVIARLERARSASAQLRALAQHETTLGDRSRETTIPPHESSSPKASPTQRAPSASGQAPSVELSASAERPLPPTGTGAR